MENKPIVTWHGDQAVFESLHQRVVQMLPIDTIEWRRSYGRKPCTIHVHATFVPFNPGILPGEDEALLLGRPFFHTFWTDCDLDGYKTSVKDEIMEWISALRDKNISDWLIIVVVNEESKVKSKLLRSSVIDKVKSDFCNKNPDRCVSLNEPFKTDSRSSESWQLMLGRMQTLLLYSFNDCMTRFEDNMRNQREKRTNLGWNFSTYFMLQEELAFMYEMLGMFDDALVQYDELDALFTQFVVNHVAGDTSEWLFIYSEIQTHSWDGICLSQPINIEKRQLIKRNNAALLDIRNYLFSRQCTLLFLMYRPEEVAERSIPFMYNLIQELDSLEISLPEGSVACWVFLSCLEVLRTCEKFAETGKMDTHTLSTANLWNYARTKMLELGQLCGLMPDLETTSEHLNLVVDLLAGLQTEPGDSPPVDKLREALSSKGAFTKHYMEMSEYAMGTYKHIGRLRSARFIGKDLAEFYMKQNEPQKAELFLNDALKIYHKEGWKMLAADTQLELARCLRKLDQPKKFVKTCILVSSSSTLSMELRCNHWEEAIKTVQSQPEVEYHAPLSCGFKLKHLKPVEKTMTVNGVSEMELVLLNNLPVAVTLDSIVISLTPATPETIEDILEEDGMDVLSKSMRRRNISGSSGVAFMAKPVLDLDVCTEVREGVASVGLMCHTMQQNFVVVPEYNNDLDAEPSHASSTDLTLTNSDVTVQPGINHVILSGVFAEVGIYNLNHLYLHTNGIDFSDEIKPVHTMQIVNKPATASLPHSEIPKWAGVEQDLIIQLDSGTLTVSKKQDATITLPAGLHIVSHSVYEMNKQEPDLKTGKIKKLDDGNQQYTLQLPTCSPYKMYSLHLRTFCDLNLHESPIEQDIFKEVVLCSDWLDQPWKSQIKFILPLSISHKVYTAAHKKFLQVLLEGCGLPLRLYSPQMNSDSSDINLQFITSGRDEWTLTKENKVSFVWQVEKISDNFPRFGCELLLKYQSLTDSLVQEIKYPLVLENYQTLYTIKANVNNEHDHYQAGHSYQYNIQIQNHHSSMENVTYHVNADDKQWCLMGKSSGAIEADNANFEATIDIVPLTAGCLKLPNIQLQWYKNCENTSSDDIESKNFLPGQVYNYSAASQLLILPNNNMSAIDISL